jgi:SNF2 family DNA or RNA helicase
LKELFSLIHFINPDLFSDEVSFLKTFTELENKENEKIEQLQNILKPFILRRHKKDVLKDLPKKKEFILYSHLTKLQKKFYIGLLKKDSTVFSKQGSRNLVNMIMSLRKCCNHPYLFQGAEPEPFSEGEHIVNNSGKSIYFICLKKSDFA